MCRKGACGHPAANASISSATFSLLALFFAVGAPLGPAYQINITSFIGVFARVNLSADATLGLTSVRVSSPLAGSATLSYSDFVASECQGLCPGIANDKTSRGSALLTLLKQAGGGAGQGAMACFFLSALCLLVHVVGTIMHACNLRHAPQPCANCCASTPLGLTASLLGYALLVAGCALVWGVFGSLASAAAAYALSSAGFLAATVAWFPLTAPVLAGVALGFATIALACELGARLCCREWAPPAAAFTSSGPAGPTVVVLHPDSAAVGGGGGAGGGGWGVQHQHPQPLPQAVYAPSYVLPPAPAMAQPHYGLPPPPGMGHPPPRPHKEAPPLITAAAAPPPAMTHWRMATDGTDTCACAARRATRLRKTPRHPASPHTPSHRRSPPLPAPVIRCAGYTCDETGAVEWVIPPGGVRVS